MTETDQKLGGQVEALVHALQEARKEIIHEAQATAKRAGQEIQATGNQARREIEAVGTQTKEYAEALAQASVEYGSGVGPAIRTLRLGGEHPWDEDKDVTHVSCPDPEHCVVYEVRRLR